jgi:hypothetical protein
MEIVFTSYDFPFHASHLCAKTHSATAICPIFFTSYIQCGLVLLTVYFSPISNATKIRHIAVAWVIHPLNSIRILISMGVVNRNVEQSWPTIKTLASLSSPNISSLINRTLPALPCQILEFTGAEAAATK